MKKGGRLAIWLPTLIVIICWVGAVIALHLFVLSTRIRDTSLSLAVSLAIVQSVCVSVLLIGLMVTKWVEARHEARSAELRVRIAETLASDVAGQDRLRELRRYLAVSKRDVEREIAAMAATLRGSSRERVLKLGRELGVTAPESEERRAQIFARAARGNRLERAVAAEELEPDARALAEVQIPRALRSRHVAEVLAALEMLLAWRRSLPVPEVGSVVRHPNPQVRAAALRALPYAAPGDAAANIRIALRDPDPEVRRAAAETGRKLRLDALLGTLVENIRDSDRAAALAAAFAVAVMPDGASRLQEVVASADRAAAAVAFEALEKATMGRLHLA